MNNLYHKLALASVCTALGLALVANKEAKAAVFTLTPTPSYSRRRYEGSGRAGRLYFW
jgi:hypothetical protein